MRKMIGLMAVFAVLIGIVPAMAQSDEAVDFVPFSNTIYGITGIVPDGWREIGGGTFARSNGLGDVAMLAQQSAPLSADELLTALLPQFRLTEAPESVGDYTSEPLTWTLYAIDVEVPGMIVAIDLALTEEEGVTYLVLLQSSQEERDVLYDTVFVPALDGFIVGAEAVEEEDVDLPYHVEEVRFGHSDITLAGTLTLPEGDGQYAAVILITGSGAQDRDESLEPAASIKPFRLIADYLTREGFAVLRYDDRGFAESTGDFESATSADFADDVASAIDYLLTRPEIDAEHIGLLGHSEGGMVAAIVAANRDDVAFIISMAGTSVSGREVLAVQNARIQAVMGIDATVIEEQVILQQAFFDAILEGTEDEQAETLYALAMYQLENLPEEQLGGLTDFESYAETLVEQQLSVYQGDWMRFFLGYDPADDWSQITVPVLVLLGDLDVQVDVEQQIPAYEDAFAQAGNEDYEIVVFPTGNHLFQDAVTGGIEEYAILKQEFLPEFLPTIVDWLMERFN